MTEVMKVSKSSLEITIETITPEKALEYLEKAATAGIRNRSVSDARVAMLADAIRKGEWKVTHQGLAFDQDGRLVDGQHRLWGCYEAKKPIQIVVTRGVASADMTLIDRGRSRSLGDVLTIDGEKKGAKKAAIARMLGAFLKGKGDGDPKHQRLLDSEIRKIVGQYHDDLEWFSGLAVNGAFASAPLAACFVYAHSIAPAAVEAVAEKFLLGTNLVRGDPMHTMRQHLLRNTTDSYLRRFTMRMALMRAMFSAIARSLKGEELHRIDTDSMAGFDWIRSQKGTR